MATLPTSTLVADLHGKYYKHAAAGRVFHGSTAAAGVVIPISTTLTPTFSFWNPAGSETNAVLIGLTVGWSATTAALGTIGYSYTANAGATISTTAPYVAFGTGTPVNGLVSQGNQSKMKFAGGGTTTLVAAATWFRGTGFSVTATTAATATGPGWCWRDDIDGAVIVPPSTGIHVFGSTAIAITATMTLSWIEVPANDQEFGA